MRAEGNNDSVVCHTDLGTYRVIIVETGNSLMEIDCHLLLLTILPIGEARAAQLSTCCSGGQGIHRGDWYLPDGTILLYPGRSVPICEGRTAQIAVIRRTTAMDQLVSIAVVLAVFHDTDISVRDTVYVVLYTSSGGILYCTYCPVCRLIPDLSVSQEM